jgi:hypothetical protein
MKIKYFKIGERVSYKGFRGTVCSNLIQAESAGVGSFQSYLIKFDDSPWFENKEMEIGSRFFPINSELLEKIVD